MLIICNLSRSKLIYFRKVISHHVFIRTTSINGNDSDCNCWNIKSKAQACQFAIIRLLSSNQLSRTAIWIIFLTFNILYYNRFELNGVKELGETFQRFVLPNKITINAFFKFNFRVTTIKKLVKFWNDAWKIGLWQIVEILILCTLSQIEWLMRIF